MTTICPCSICFERSIAACNAAPDELPARIPSFNARPDTFVNASWSEIT